MGYNCHSISDLVCRIKNGSSAGKDVAVVPFSSVREEVLKILKEEGFISGYTISGNDVKKVLTVCLKYYGSSPVINNLSVVSKPGKRVYCPASAIPVVKNGFGLAILSTSAGIITNHNAKDKNLGGEILLKIF